MHLSLIMFRERNIHNSVMIIIKCFAYNMYFTMQMEDNLAVELYTYQLDNVAIFCWDIDLHALWFWLHIPCHVSITLN